MQFHDRYFNEIAHQLLLETRQESVPYRGQVHIQREILLEQRASERAHRRIVGEVEVNL